MDQQVPLPKKIYSSRGETTQIFYKNPFHFASFCVPHLWIEGTYFLHNVTNTYCSLSKKLLNLHFRIRKSQTGSPVPVTEKPEVLNTRFKLKNMEHNLLVTFCSKTIFWCTSKCSKNIGWWHQNWSDIGTNCNLSLQHDSNCS